MMLSERFVAIGERISLEPLEPYWQRSRQWWSQLSLREQILLGTLASVAAFAILLIGVIVPLRDVRAEARADIRNAELLEARLRAGGDLGKLGRVRRGTASAIVTDSAAAANLTIQRIEPEAGNTRVVLADASFEQVMTWIAELEQTSRLRVVEADIERKPSPGVVSASVMLAD